MPRFASRCPRACALLLACLLLPATATAQITEDLDASGAGSG